VTSIEEAGEADAAGEEESSAPDTSALVLSEEADKLGLVGLEEESEGEVAETVPMVMGVAEEGAAVTVMTPALRPD
jgi:hypothetical protein